MPNSSFELFWPEVYKFSIGLVNSNMNYFLTNRTIVPDDSHQIVTGSGSGGIDLEPHFYHQDNQTLDTLSSNIQSILLSSTASVTASGAANYTANCTDFYREVRRSYSSTLELLNRINYSIITLGILFNILNLVVLLNSKLNESPYTYLTFLALSDLGALCMIGVNKLAEIMNNSTLYVVHLYVVTPLINVFLGTSMYITLALTIERFIFVHSPFKAMLICRKSIARRVCLVVFVFSLLRSVYLPFMYGKNPCMSNAFDQKKLKAIDIYEFLISLAIPYTIIFVANISLICSLSKQNSLMNVPLSPLFSNMSHFSFKSFQEYQNIAVRNSGQQQPTRQGGGDRVMTAIEMMDQQQQQTAGNRPPLAKSKSAGSDRGCSISSNSFKKKLKKSSRFSLNLDAVIHSGNGKAATASSNERNGSTRSSKSNSLYHRTSNQREMKNQRKLTTSLIIILCLLLVCYLPSFLFEESLADLIFGEHNSRTEESKRALKIKAIGHRISLILMYINCSANFLIYCISNKKFNNSLKYLVKRSSLYKLVVNICLSKFVRTDSKLQLDSLTYRNEIQELLYNNQNNNQNNHHPQPEPAASPVAPVVTNNKSRNPSLRSSFTNHQKPNENETNYFNRLKKWNRLSQASASKAAAATRSDPNQNQTDQPWADTSAGGAKLIKYRNDDYIILDKSYTII